MDVSVIQKYCTCMNNKMSNDETESITQWEKTHVAEEGRATRKRAGNNWALSIYACVIA